MHVCMHNCELLKRIESAIYWRFEETVVALIEHHGSR